MKSQITPTLISLIIIVSLTFSLLKFYEFAYVRIKVDVGDTTEPDYVAMTTLTVTTTTTTTTSTIANDAEIIVNDATTISDAEMTPLTVTDTTTPEDGEAADWPVPVDLQPQQVHLSYLDDPSEMCVTWVTLNGPYHDNRSLVHFSEDITLNVRTEVVGNIYELVDLGPEKRTIWNHFACMQGLKPNTRYFYRVGSSEGWSTVFYFKTFHRNLDKPVRVAVFADYGNPYGYATGPLQVETQRGNLDMVWHVGDIAYQLEAHDGRTGDAFMRQIEPIAGYIPYQVTAGNHESNYIYLHYKARYNMPSNGYGEDLKNMFYSFNVGRAHVVVYSTELYYYYDTSKKNVSQQFAWLEKDLTEANKPMNRAKRPWIIALSHKNWYCSPNPATWGDADYCAFKNISERIGYGDNGTYALEPLFMKHNVDVLFAGHEHNYERTWPVYNYTVYNGSNPDNPYENAGGIVQVVTGAAGPNGSPTLFQLNKPSFSAFRYANWSYGTLEICNKTHMKYQQISIVDTKNPTKIDEFVMVKTNKRRG